MVYAYKKLPTSLKRKAGRFLYISSKQSRSLITLMIYINDYFNLL